MRVLLNRNLNDENIFPLKGITSVEAITAVSLPLSSSEGTELKCGCEITVSLEK
jgi:hypothetical protein